jgi:CBS domain-containing protein
MTATPQSHAQVIRLPRRALVSISPEASLRAAVRLMRAEDVSALVVGEPGRTVSVFTERDVTSAVADGADPATAIANLASARPVTVDGQTPVAVAAARMLEHGIRHLVVVEGDRAVGLVSMRDALAALLAGSGPPEVLVVLGEVARPTRPWPG